MTYKSRLHQIVFCIATLLIAGILLFSAIEHLSNPYAFLLSVLRYSVVSGTLAEWTAMVLPAFQFSLAIVMLSFSLPRLSSTLAACLLLFFTLLQMSALIRELDISCGCFGSFSESISWWTVGRNLALLSVCLLLCVLAFRRPVEKPELTELESSCVSPT